jgi:hypothetical protein
MRPLASPTPLYFMPPDKHVTREVPTIMSGAFTMLYEGCFGPLSKTFVTTTEGTLMQADNTEYGITYLDDFK